VIVLSSNSLSTSSVTHFSRPAYVQIKSLSFPRSVILG